MSRTLGPELYDAIVTSAAVICAGGGRTGHMESLCRSRGIPVLRVDRAELARARRAGHRTDRPTVGHPRRGRGAAGRTPVAPYRRRRRTSGRSAWSSPTRPTCRRRTRSVPRVEQVTSFFVREEFVCLAAGLSPLDALRVGRAGGRGVRGRPRIGAVHDRQGASARPAVWSCGCSTCDPTTPPGSPTGVDGGPEPNPDLGLHGARWLLREPHYPRAFQALRAYVRERLGPDADTAELRGAVRQRPGRVPAPATAPRAVRRRPRSRSSSRHRPPCTPRPGSATPAPAELFVGTKDLVQFYLAADRGNHLVADSYQTRHPAVMAGLGQVVASARRARHAGCTCSRLSPTWTTTCGGYRRTAS